MSKLNQLIGICRTKSRVNVRWYIAGLLLLTTLLSYAEDYAKLVMAFSLAFGLAMPFTGRFVDRIGTRRGLAIFMTAWSIASMAHALGSGILSFGVCRAILGVTESNNFPSAAKAVSEWFPAKERATATGVYNCGAGLGALIAPPLIAGILIPRYGWRASFLTTGALGFILVWGWLRMYHLPAQHPAATPVELDYIKGDQEEDLEKPARGVWREVLAQRSFWGIGLCRVVSGPVWWFYLAWLPPYLNDVRHFNLSQIPMFAWMPFLAADLGSIVGGAMSSYLIKRSYPTVTARKIAMCTFAALMPLNAPELTRPLPYWRCCL